MDVDERNNYTDVEMSIYRTSQNSFVCCLKNPGMDILKIDIFDLNGNFVMQVFNDTPYVNPLEVKIDTRNLSSGVYFIRAYSEDYSIVKKFVLRD